MHRPLRAISAFALVVACSAGSSRRAEPTDLSGSSGGSTGGTMASAPASDTEAGAADGSSGGPSDAAAGGSESGGPGTTFLDAEAGGVEYPPPCAADTAFQADGASFVYPTPNRLASALSELTYDSATHPVAVAIQGKPGRGAAGSATEDISSSLWGFGPKTKATTVFFEPGGVRFGAPQVASDLALVDKMGPTSLALENVSVHGFMGLGCASGMFTLDAAIPASEGSHVLHLAAGDARIDALADDGGREAGSFTGASIRMIFTAESVPFDFTTMP